MLSMRLVTRGNLPQYAATVQRLHTSTIALDSSSSSSSDSDSDTKSSKKKLEAKTVISKEQKQVLQEETKSRLNRLLDQMIKVTKPSKPIELPIAPEKIKLPKPKRYEDEFIGAAKEVATALGGDVEKTESELLNKLLSGENAKSENMSEKSSPVTLNDVISGMKIDRTPAEKPSLPQKLSRSAKVQEMARKFQSIDAAKSNRRQPQPRNINQPTEAGNLYGGSLVGIFDRHINSEKTSDAPQLSTWEHLEKREFKLALSHPPENYFQELIQWTEQGKLWKFPIDNEQGLEEEQNIHFSEHVFMERHLKGWCPKSGPIRHFMELVCVGLSKNPYMTAHQKREHLRWYQEFFDSKQDLLREIGAIEATIPQEKQIEAQ